MSGIGHVIPPFLAAMSEEEVREWWYRAYKPIDPATIDRARELWEAAMKRPPLRDDDYIFKAEP